MKCSKCGTEFDEGIFCPECGARVESAEKFEDVSRNADAQTPAPERSAEQEAEIERQKTEQARLEKAKIEKELELKKLAVEKDNAEREKAEKAAEQNRIQEEERRLQEERERKKREERKLENEGRTMSTLSLVFGVIAIVSMGCFFVPEILGIIFATRGKKQGVMLPRAKAGLICSFISIAILAVIIIVMIVFSVM